MKEIIHYKRKDYNKDGFHKTNKTLFSDFVNDCEKQFYEKHHPNAANYLYVNNSGMILLQACFNDVEDNTFGMDMIDGEVDLDTNIEMDKHSKKEMIYALDNSIEEPLFLVIDDSLTDNVLLFEYKSETDLEDAEDNLPDDYITEDLDKYNEDDAMVHFRSKIILKEWCESIGDIDKIKQLDKEMVALITRHFVDDPILKRRRRMIKEGRAPFNNIGEKNVSDKNVNTGKLIMKNE